MAVWLLWPFWHLSLTFGDHTWVSPSRIYSLPTLLAVGENLPPETLESVLADLDYGRRDGEFPAPGEYTSTGDRWIVHRRAFPGTRGVQGPALLEIDISGRTIRAISLRGEPVDEVALDPVLLATLVDQAREESRPVELDELPESLVQAVLAAEDAGFFGHAGLSIRGISRAAWNNVVADGPLQGGSTLTQQLVKNLYLTHERTLGRKLREAVLSVLIELRYDKRAVLEAYLNEVYWGHVGGLNLIGVGAAARAYFGKDAAHLDLEEAATLAGVIQAPNRHSPARHPERARRRRDWVLSRMRELGWIDETDYLAAVARPVEIRPYRGASRLAPYFVDRALAEVEARYDVDPRNRGGLSILTTLDWRDQRAAEDALEAGLDALGREEGDGADDLQAALVSVSPQSGEIRAWVGGRDYGDSQFDRAGQGRRQAGSAFKPVVYAAALTRGLVTPASMIPDEPLTVRTAGITWEPQNDDRSFRGWVSVRTALERSLNVPTARIALETGLDTVLETARALGIEGRLEALPALSLGAFEVTPEEMSSVYSTLAAGGVRHRPRAVRSILGSDRRPLDGPTTPDSSRALTPQVAYVLTSLLQGVVDHGTAHAVRALGLQGPVAGKTGTTNGRRDNWFGGYSPDRATVVWVGYDDNRETSLSGARAALPIWTRFAIAVRPSGGYDHFARPPGVEMVTVDPETGLRATLDCPSYRGEAFLEGQAPWRFCYLHQRGGFTSRRALGAERELGAADEVTAPRAEPERRSWWKRILRKKSRKPKDDG